MPSFSRAQLEELLEKQGTNLNLQNADLEGVDLSRLDLSGADLRNANLTEADLALTNLSRTLLAGTRFSGVLFDGTKLAGASLEGADFSGADLSYADFEGVDLKGVDLSGANFIKADLSEMDLSEAILHETSFQQTSLNNTKLQGASLQGAELYRTDLRGATLREAKLNKAQFFGVDLRGADLSGANLEGAELTDIRYDAQTRWPQGFTPNATSFDEELSSLQEFEWFKVRAENQDFEAQSGLYTFGFHPGNVTAIVFSPAGDTLATGSLDGTIILWEVATANQLKTFNFNQPSAWVMALAFSPDGKWLAAGYREGEIKVWEVATSQEMVTLNQAMGDMEVLVLAFHPLGKGEYLYSYSKNNQRISGAYNVIRMWQVPTTTLLLELETGASFGKGFALSPDGKWLAASGRPPLDYRPDQILHSINQLEVDKLSQIELMKQIQPMVQAQLSESLKLWETATGQEARILPGSSSGLQALSFSRDSKLLAGGEGKVIKLWDSLSGQKVGSFESRGGSVCALLFNPADTHLISTHEDLSYEGCNLKVWEVSSGKLLRMYPFPEGNKPVLALNPTGNLLVTGITATLLIWQVAW
jgi:uncharacterized protein YjbI with pentapeptide repeats/WD40 repeat protein